MAITNPTVVTVSESVTDITVTGQETISVDITQSDVTVEVNNFVLPNQYQDAQNTVVSPYGTITATNVQDALKQLADQDFRSNDTPTGTNVSEGDTWYDLDDNTLKVYREISSGVFAWTNVVIAETNDTLDAGAF
jgi:hypothetical protein|tara:strand:+ start:4143 stop:4547 length:405 start_codon:yes stop_codon:yes gene_type:complete